MGSNNSKNVKLQEKYVNEKIEFIKLNYPVEWDKLVRTQGMKRIRGKLRTIFNDKPSIYTFFNHNEYKSIQKLISRN